jgi:hypothetical protein
MVDPAPDAFVSVVLNHEYRSSSYDSWRKGMKTRTRSSSGLSAFHHVISGRQTLIAWWMPTRGYPFTPDQHRDNMVQLQGYNRGATTGRAPNDARTILAPLKMSGPTLTSGIEQENSSPMQRITGLHLFALETITQAASQPEVGFLVASSVRLGNDVVNF